MNGWFTEEEKREALALAYMRHCPSCHALPGQECASLLDGQVARRKSIHVPHVRRFSLHHLERAS
jgi:hypothetical protein